MDRSKVKNIFHAQSEKLPAEVSDEILSGANFKMERIVSEGQSSPPGFWYDQEQNEFVMLLCGSADILFESDETIKMSKGDYIVNPAHMKHRVDWTDPDQKTVWLALFY